MKDTHTRRRDQQRMTC